MKNRKELRLFSPSMIVALLVGTLVLFIGGNAGAVVTAQWSMDDGIGTNVADSIGSNDGTLSGGGVSWNGFGSGLTGGGSDSLNFDGSGGQVKIPSSSAFAVGSNSFTISWDMRGTADSTNNGVELVFNRGNDMRFEVYSFVDDFFVELDAHDGSSNDGKTFLQFPEYKVFTGEWVHIDVVVDRDDTAVSPHGTLSLYKDGSLVNSGFMVTSGSLDDATYKDFFIGGVVSGGPPGYDGFSFLGDLDNFVFDVDIPPLPGDFDEDNDVDGNDFGLWQAGYPTASGASLGDGDADGDGDVDGTDFGIWQSNYPTNVGGAATIPEPATLFVMLAAGLPVLLRHRRSRG